MMTSRLPWTCFLSMFWRSLFLQASWNFEKLQNLGFLYILIPCYRSLYRGEAAARLGREQAGYFNTHPYMSLLVAGTVLRLEEKQAAGQECSVEVDSFKKMVMAPFAAMGDSFFWGGVRPLAAIIGLFLAVQGSLWAPVVFLAIFNVSQLFFRISGLVIGYVQELRAIETVQRCRLPDLAVRMKEGTVILLGVLCAYLAYKGCDHQAIAPVWGFLLLPVVLLFAWMAHKGVSSLFLILLTTASLLGMALLF